MTGILASLFLLTTTGLQTGSVTRDQYGVPIITAASASEAMKLAGKSCAEDRLWQMELSRSTSRGRLAALLGPSGLASDKEVLKTAYTDEELQDQLNRLPANIRGYFDAYAEGINETIQARKEAGTLPKGYEGADPAPWTAIDSVAIGIGLAQQFGTGGAGELRNLAVVYYLKSQPCKDKWLDVYNDFAWFNDPKALCTVSDSDDPLRKSHPQFTFPTPAETKAHFKSLPPTNLLELAGAIKVASREESKLVAESNAVPFKVGSYCVVVGKGRSNSGFPMLMNGPQMGHTVPTIIHEMSIRCPEFSVTGMDLPGLPGVLIGTTKNLTWGFTSGVADVVDEIESPKVDDGHYRYGDEVLPLTKIERVIRVKGGADQVITQTRTQFGPVIFESMQGKAFYSERSSYRNREMDGIGFMIKLYGASGVQEALTASKEHPLSFNFFCASADGDTAWRFCGLVPIRPVGLDPRLPLIGTPANEWKGFIPADQMPYVVNPKSGLIANWNNKPVSWWPNFDTPVWGSVFRNRILVDSLPTGKMGMEALDRAAWSIARKDDTTCMVFLDDFKKSVGAMTGLTPIEQQAAASLQRYDGWNLSGEPGGRIYDLVVRQMRRLVVVPSVGSFLGDATLNLAAQPDLLLKALNGKSKFDFLAGRTKTAILQEAFRKAVTQLGSNTLTWGWNPGSFAAPDGTRVLYSNRGTYIQIIQQGPQLYGRSISPPGISETGPHSADQVDLAKAFAFKPMQSP